eukprot:TRINITY_DN62996_c0_g1_i1.p1 TRINITY_DN62996_c0_g1~~TRINITY_DN62996_c0_g1_i1.p1  ORF type:complete len:344 (+),score=98.27 TRINITY_DN62996_c0_g1_i1:48-1079(+)
MADGRFDDLLMNMAKKHSNVEELTFSLLSFFERRTDLFHVMETADARMGFGPGNAEKMLLKHFHFCQQRYLAQHQPHLLREPEAEGDPVAATSSSAGAAPAGASAAPAAPQPAPQKTPESVEEQEMALPEETRKKMKHISTWNGAITDKYYWSQSLQEVTVEVTMEPCKASDVDVDITATRLCIKRQGETVLEGKLHEKVATEDTVWHLEEGHQVILSLQKSRETWWKCVLEGDPEIDTTKVESTRSMEEYDGETQGAIRKIMFDQNQKLQGKPSSDQIRTAEMMKDAWNAPGSPFRGTDFDPTLLNLSGPVGEEFFQDMEAKRIAGARERMQTQEGSASSSQ